MNETLLLIVLMCLLLLHLLTLALVKWLENDVKNLLGALPNLTTDNKDVILDAINKILEEA